MQPSQLSRSFFRGWLAGPALAAAALAAGACGAESPARNGNTTPPPAPVSTTAPGQASGPSAAPPPASAPPVAAPRAPDVLPPLPLEAFPGARPVDVIQGVYEFAARHPEVLGHVPCFCGCERVGHQGNDDCFVQARDAATGQVTWDAHGAT